MVLGIDRRRARRASSTARSPARCKAYRGAHEVITTIMLNFIAIYVGRVPGRPRRAAAGHGDAARPYSETLPGSATLPARLGRDPASVHIGIFIALGAAVVYWVVLEADDARLRGAGRRLQPRGGALRRRLGAARRSCWRWASRRVRRPRRLGRGRSARYDQVHGPRPGRARRPRLHRHRRRPARPQHPIGIVLAALLFAGLDSGARLLSRRVLGRAGAARWRRSSRALMILLVGGEAILRWLFPGACAATRRAADAGLAGRRPTSPPAGAGVTVTAPPPPRRRPSRRRSAPALTPTRCSGSASAWRWWPCWSRPADPARDAGRAARASRSPALLCVGCAAEPRAPAGGRADRGRRRGLLPACSPTPTRRRQRSRSRAS